MSSSQIPVLPAKLTACRKRKGVSLAAIASATKIGTRYLEAIERGEFHRLPGGVYGLSYVRQYARAIGYDEDELVECFRAVVAPEDSFPAPPPAPDGWISRLLDRIFSLKFVAAVTDLPHPRM